MLKHIIFAWKLLWQEWRQGQWLIIFFALILAVTVMSSMHFITERVIHGIYQTSSRILGADLVISSSTPIPHDWITKARATGLRTAELWQFPSVISTKQETQLINVQAVSDNYPLLTISSKPLSLHRGQALIDNNLKSRLRLSKQDTLQIGVALFSINHQVPPNLFTDAIWQLMPRAMILLADIPATKTILPGSRVDYRLLMTGSPTSLNQFKLWVFPRLQSNQRLLDIRDQQRSIQTIFSQTQNYVQLVLFICLLLSGIAIYVSARYYAQSHQNQVALLRCFGASQKQLLTIYCWQLLLIAVVSAKIGVTLAYFLQNLVARIFKIYFYFDLPPAGYSPILFGFISSLLLLFACAYPVIAQLPKVPPIRIWREKITFSAFSNYQYLTIMTILFIAYLNWIFDFSIISLLFLDLILLSIGCLYLASLGILAILNRVCDKTRGIWQVGLIQVVRSPERLAMQVTAYSLVFMPLFILLFLYHGILAHWTTDLPKNAPNYFLFNIGTTDVSTLRQFFNRHQIKIEDIYPMVKARLVSLNNHPILTAVPINARLHNVLHRDLNLSAMRKYPSDNRVIAGHPWTDADNNQPLISIAESVATDLHLKIGDRLTFQINDQSLSGTINNIRHIHWESMHPNFFVIFPPQTLDRFNRTYITSFYLSKEKISLVNVLINTFPNTTLINISALLAQIKIILDKAILILTYLFLFSLLAGLFISLSIYHISKHEKKKWMRLLTLLGANRFFIRRVLSIEGLVLLFSVLILSYTLAKLITALLMQMLFPA